MCRNKTINFVKRKRQNKLQKKKIFVVVLCSTLYKTDF